MSQSKQKKSDEKRLAALKQKEAQLNAQIARLQKKAKIEARKKDTRRKIIVGAAVLAHAKLHPDFAKQLSAVLKVAVTKDTDNELIRECWQ